MSVRNALLALVAQQPAGVYRLKQMFEEQTCGAWPLNIGQVYQTMQRLERDGQVVSHAETNAGRDSEVFELTDAGREVLAAWWSTPVPREHPERDELVMKLAVAAADPTVDVEAMIQTQRRSTLGSLRDVTRLKASADEGELAWKLILERHIFDLEAELNWLDHIESGAVSEAARRAAFAAAKGRLMNWAQAEAGRSSTRTDYKNALALCPRRGSDRKGKAAGFPAAFLLCLLRLPVSSATIQTGVAIRLAVFPLLILKG